MRHRDAHATGGRVDGVPPGPELPGGDGPDGADAHEEAAVRWALHALDPDEETAFRTHLEVCPVCRGVVAEVTATLGAVALALPPQEPPPGLRARILDAAAAEPAPDTAEPAPDTAEPAPDTEVVPIGRPRRHPSRRRWLVRAGAVAASLVVVAAVGGIIAADRALERSRDEAAAAAAAAQRSDQVVQVIAAAGAPGARHATLATGSGGLAGLVVDTGRGAALLTTGLAGNAPDRTYVLWGLAADPDTAPTGLGTFDVPGVAPSARSVVSPVDRPFAGYAVSLEIGRTVPAAPTDIVATGQVSQ